MTLLEIRSQTLYSVSAGWKRTNQAWDGIKWGGLMDMDE